MTRIVGEVHTLVGKVTTQLNNTAWLGRTGFGGDWTGQRDLQMNKVSQTL